MGDKAWFGGKLGTKYLSVQTVPTTSWYDPFGNSWTVRGSVGLVHAKKQVVEVMVLMVWLFHLWAALSTGWLVFVGGYRACLGSEWR